jgi:FKBP-type peptidyl-prolyl cis-trans isomerase SlyD
MSKPKVITLTYELRSAGMQGEIIETAGKDNPAEFLFGVGNLIPEFEDQIIDLEQGQTFDFKINVENAYGPVDEAAVVELPRNIFTIDGQEADDLLVLGNTVPMRDQNGQPLQGKIVDIKEEHVTMDFNHPLAGHDLHFKGEVLSTREANQEEIEHRHVHTGEHGH